MKIECPHCTQRIALDEETLVALAEIDAFECPSCGKPVPSPVKVADEPEVPSSPAPNTTVPNPFLAAFLRMNRTTRALGLLALLVIGGAAIFLATRKSGDTYKTTIKNRETIIHNEFFTRLIASGATTLEELRKIETFAAYGDGYVGLSEEAWTWDEAKLLARRTGGKILDLALTPRESQKEMGIWLAEAFPNAIGRAAWVQDQSMARGIDAPDLLPSTDPDTRWRVFLSWSETTEWQNHGWSWRIDPNFDEALPFTEWGLAAVRSGKFWGLVNEDGEFVQEARFDEIGKFSDQGCARVLAGGQWGVVNRLGQLVANPEWEDVQDQINGFTPVKREGKWGYLDESGALAIPCEWDDAWRFSPEGFAVVTRKGKRGILDRTGKVVVAAEWEGAINFSKEGLGLVRLGSRWTLIDTRGESLTPSFLKTLWRDRRWDLGFLPHEDGATARDGSPILGERRDRYLAFLEPEKRFSEGLGRIDTEAGSGFVDAFGEWYIAPTEYFCRDFHGGFAAASKEGKWGFIDRSGALVIEPAWDEVGDFVQGRASVKRGERWGWIAGNGTVISDPVWDEVRPFREGFSAVRRDEKWGFLDRNGKVIAQPAWKAVGDFAEGFASVQIEPTPEQLAMVPTYHRNFGFWSFIDHTGKTAFDGRTWFQPVYSRTIPPAFAKGVVSGQLVDGPVWQFVRMDAQGQVLPLRGGGDTSAIAGGLVLHEEPSQGLYLDRHGRSEISGALRDAEGGLVMAGVNRRADNLADLIPYAEPPKYGIIDMTGKVIVPPTWEEAKILSRDRVWFKVAGKCGLADGQGRILVEPTWDELVILAVESSSLDDDGETLLFGDSVMNRGAGTRFLSPWIRVREGDTTRILRANGEPAIPDTLRNAEYVDFYGPERLVITQKDEDGNNLRSLYHPATGELTRFPGAARLHYNWNTAIHGMLWKLVHLDSGIVWRLRSLQGADPGHTQSFMEEPVGWGFLEGRALLRKSDGMIYIGTDGKAISAERWEEANEFSEGRAAVKRAGKWGYIGRDGAMVTEMEYEEAQDFSEGLAAVKVEGRWGFIDPRGTVAIAPVWDEAQSFMRWYGEPEEGVEEVPHLDVAEVKINGAAALIGRDGGLILDPRTPKLERIGSAYSNGQDQLIVMRKGRAVEVVTRAWEKSPQSWRPYSESSPARRWQPVANSSRWALVDETGTALTDADWTRPGYDVKIDPFSGNLISGRNLDEQYGLLRRDGSLVLEPKFDRIAWVAPGIAAVWNRDEGGLVDADGNWVFEDTDEIRIARFSSGRTPRTSPQFRHGLALIEDVPKWGYARLNRTSAAPETP